MENDNSTVTINPKLDSGEEPKTNGELEQQERDDERGENPNSTSGTDEGAPRLPSSTRTPFTNLSQVDADLALARTLQEQERAYMMLTMGNSGSDYGSWEAGSYFDDYDEDDEEEGDEDEDEDAFVDPGVGGEGDGHGEVEINSSDVDEDAFDVHAHSHGDVGESIARADIDPAAFDSDEAYARALQDAEEREMAARLFALAGIHDINDREAEVIGDHGGNSQETWEEVDPDELSYEELLALGEVVGIESRGLSVATIASLPSINYKLGSSQNGSNDSCVICRLDYEDGETLTLLSCKHSYHSECINDWLKINKICPVCSAEVSTSGHS